MGAAMHQTCNPYDGLYLALRRDAASNATWWQRALCALVRWRLASDYCHAGIVCDGVLHHVTTQDGLTQTEDWTPRRWDLVRLPDSRRADLAYALREYKGAQYDWFSLLAFALPGRYSDHKRLYCMELPAIVLSVPMNERVTPERLLLASICKRGRAC